MPDSCDNGNVDDVSIAIVETPWLHVNNNENNNNENHEEEEEVVAALRTRYVAMRAGRARTETRTSVMRRPSVEAVTSCDTDSRGKQGKDEDDDNDDEDDDDIMRNTMMTTMMMMMIRIMLDKG